MKLNVVIGIKHFKQIIMMTNLLDRSTLSDEISDNTKSSGNTQEKKNRKILTKKKETKGKNKNCKKKLSLRKMKKMANAKFKLLRKEKVI